MVVVDVEVEVELLVVVVEVEVDVLVDVEVELLVVVVEVEVEVEVDVEVEVEVDVVAYAPSVKTNPTGLVPAKVTWIPYVTEIGLSIGNITLVFAAAFKTQIVVPPAPVVKSFTVKVAASDPAVKPIA